mgnify:FL=1
MLSVACWVALSALVCLPASWWTLLGYAAVAGVAVGWLILRPKG